MEKKLKTVIKNSYEKNDYIKKYRSREPYPFEKMIFDRVINMLPSDAKILDLGCGNGYPFDSYFSTKGFELLGIDFCGRNIEAAATLNPSGKYLYCDIEDYEFDQKFSLVMALFSVIHIPRQNHKSLFEKIYNCLNPDGILLLTLRDEDSGEIKHKDDFCGQQMYWSYYDYNYYKNLLTELGFETVFSKNQNEFEPLESHNWLILKKDKVD